MASSERVKELDRLVRIRLRPAHTDRAPHLEILDQKRLDTQAFIELGHPGEAAWRCRSKFETGWSRSALEGVRRVRCGIRPPARRSHGVFRGVEYLAGPMAAICLGSDRRLAGRRTRTAWSAVLRTDEALGKRHDEALQPIESLESSLGEFLQAAN